MVCLSCGYLSKGIHFLCSYFRIGGASIIAHTAHQINEEIHDKEVRLISAQGEQLGIMPLAEAMAKAGDADLDLVKISPNAVPPVPFLIIILYETLIPQHFDVTLFIST